jgi:hypothetical protein
LSSRKTFLNQIPSVPIAFNVPTGNRIARWQVNGANSTVFMSLTLLAGGREPKLVALLYVQGHISTGDDD